jgi:thymidylate synthase ThyX
MKIVEPSVEVIFWAPEDSGTLEEGIEKAARTCYKSEGKIGEGTADKLIRKLRKSGHHAMLEFGYIMARIIADRGLCYDCETEVLTRDGWKFFSDTSDNDDFLTLNVSTFEAEYQKRIDYTCEPWDGDLICGISSMVDFAVTPNHRMFWFHYDSRKNKKWQISKAREIYGRRVKFKRGLFVDMPGEITMEDFEEIHPKAMSLDFARFMGLFITDGSLERYEINGVKKNGGRVNIAQVKSSGRKYIKEVLDRLGWCETENENGFRIGDTFLYNILRRFFPKFGKKSYDCRCPNFIRFASKEYIEAFLEGVIVGDGNIHKKNGHIVVYTSSYGFAGDLQELFLKIGFCASVRIDDRVGESHLQNGQEIRRNVPGYIVSVTKRTNDHLFGKKNWFRKYYNGNVYCVTVPNGTLYVRRNGKSFWSGNSHELCRHRLASFAQESTRYCNYNSERFDSEISVIEPPGLTEEQRVIWSVAMADAERHYMTLIKIGAKPQIARSVLPIGLKTEIVIGANPREWRHIFKMRCDKYAHPIIRSIMIEILLQCRDKYSAIFDDLFDDLSDELINKWSELKDKTMREAIMKYIVD